MRNAMLSLAAAFALGLSACVEDLAEATSALPPDPGAQGQVTVAGVDADADGLRDDVQLHIHAAYAGGESRDGAVQLAKAIQDMLLNGSTKPGAVAAGLSLNRAVDCLYGLDAAKFGERVEDIEGVVVNTGARARAYAKAGAFLSGATYGVSTVADNAASCEESP
jgi:hypothetical protein